LLQKTMGIVPPIIILVHRVPVNVPAADGVVYAATKSFLTTFSRALHKGLRGKGVRIQALCPGFTHTKFHEPSDIMDMDVHRIPAILWMDARRVVSVSLKALEWDQAVVIPGLIYKLAVFFGRLGFV